MDMVSGGWAPCRSRGPSIRLSEWLFRTATSRRPLGVDISMPPQRSSAAPLAFNLSVLLAHFALQPPSSPCPWSGNPCPIPGTIICASTPEPPVWTRIKFAVICCDFATLTMHEQEQFSVAFVNNRTVKLPATG
jgi:hypothetical protein